MSNLIVFAALATALNISAPVSIPLQHPLPGLDDVQAMVNGRTGTFLFDSGSGVTQLTPAFAKAVGCTPWGKITGFRAKGDRLDLQRCNSVKLNVGGTPSTVIDEPGVIDLSKMLGSWAISSMESSLSMPSRFRLSRSALLKTR